MLLAILILLPNIILADDACDVATNLMNKILNAETAEEAFTSYTNPFEYINCGKSEMIHLDEKLRKQIEKRMKEKKEAMQRGKMDFKREVKDCKLDSASKKLEFSVYYPEHNVTWSYRAEIYGENFKINLENRVENDGKC